MNYASLFPDMPDSARLWIYAADRPLTPEEQQALRENLDDFAESWTSHGRDVQGKAVILHDRFVLLAATLPTGDPGSSPGQAVSGCGIDASVHALEAAAREHGFDWVSALDVLYRSSEGPARDGSVKSASRPAFSKMADTGAVTTDTPVFDLNVETVGALRAGQFEKPARRSWHADAFPLPA